MSLSMPPLRWRRAVALTLGMAVGLHAFFLHPLAAEARDMHAEQLDPTEIVQIPYDLRRLWIYVSSVTVGGLVLSSYDPHPRLSPPRFALAVARDVLPATLLTWLTYLVLGAAPGQNVWHTLAAAWYVVVLLQGDPLVRPLRSVGVLDRLSAATQRPGDASPTSLAVLQTQCVVTGTVLAHVLRLYDNGWQAQRWPVPTVLGATYGWILGPWLGLLVVLWRRRPERTDLSR